MNRKLLNILLCLTLFALVAICLVSCGGNKIEEDISVGEVYGWPFDYEGSASEIIFELSDPSLASIVYTKEPFDNRKIVNVRALKEGEVTITAKSSADSKFESTLILNISKDALTDIGEGVLINDITIENPSAELYREDTTVTYTVKTSKLVDKIELTLIDSSDSYTPLYSFEDAKKVLDAGTYYELYSLVADKNALTDGELEPYNSGKNGKAYSVSRTEEGEEAVWEIKWNLGNTAVKFIEIVALDEDTSTTHDALAHVDIYYPTFSATESLEEIIKLWVKENVDGPLYFSIDTSDMTDEEKRLHFIELNSLAWTYDDSFALMGYPSSKAELASSESSALKILSQTDTRTFYDAIFDDSAIYRYNFNSMLAQYSMVSSLDSSNPDNTQNYLQVNEVVLSNYPLHNQTFMFYYPVTDEIRAVIAYQNGYEIDKELFPYAHSILKRATEVLNEIIEPGMTDFDMERAIYAWMVRYQGQQINELPSTFSEEEKYFSAKTAYGFLNGYGGDCMGYSGTFFTLCNMAGVPCSTVDAYTINEGETGGPSDTFGANHRINLVRIGGEYYFVEAFWFYQKNDEGEGDFRFMNMTTEVAKNHYNWATEDIFGPPVCDYSTYLVDAHTAELLSER